MSFTTALFWFFILIGVVIYYVLPSKCKMDLVYWC